MRKNIKLKSTESSHFYTTQTNSKNNTGKIVLKKYDPIIGKHVEYKEDKL